MLEDFIQANDVKGKIITFEQEVAHCSQVAEIEEYTPVAKSILFACEDKGFVLAIVEGKKKINQTKLAHAIGTKHCRLATAEEVLSVTGYEAGGVPPISIYGIPTILDPGVLAHEWVLTGGGDKFSLLKIRSEEITRVGWDVRVEAIAQ
ncbi:MAG: YbaK/EbsC family protein [Candidatus Iainarchaeum archaeon]|uniref:YbaK/EbsC family protein n=1 Tax=Candidatus Iainarchaeum sp. TaxID=3101447 RepID=A0A7T9DJC3_9ARCH|nr:MAG: YbaK/EbsC family protein [Candidatus Diapherotrites archaeon]